MNITFFPENETSLVNNYNPLINYSNETNSLLNPDFIPYDKRPETYFVPVLFGIIFIVGVIGNGTLILIFFKHRTMRNVPNTYIMSLALADLLVIVTSVPFTSIIYTMESWPWGEQICKISETAKDISVGVSVFTLTVLSADRYFAIVDPLKKFHTSSGGRRATRTTTAVAISVWILAALCAIPAAIGSYLRNIQDHLVVCYPFPASWFDHKYPELIVLLKFLIFYVIPLSVIGFFYLKMANHLIVSTKNVPGEVQGTQRQIKARKKVAFTILVFVLLFAICFLPTHIFMLFFYFYPDAQSLYNDFWNYLRIIGFCLGYLNSCANPVALYLVSGAFRKYFNRYLFCIKQKRSRSNTCQGNQATTLSYVPTKRTQCSSKKSRIVKDCKETNLAQETSITLLGPGNGHVYKI